MTLIWTQEAVVASHARLERINMHITGKTIVVWFSCGAASAVAAKETICRYGEHNTIRIVNNPIKEEDADNQRFLRGR